MYSISVIWMKFMNYSNKNKKVIGKFKTETPKNIIIDDCVCLRSKAYSLKCKDNGEKK